MYQDLPKPPEGSQTETSQQGPPTVTQLETQQQQQGGEAAVSATDAPVTARKQLVPVRQVFHIHDADLYGGFECNY